MEDFYSFITIEGNIGAGKTTLAKLLAEDLDGSLVLEQFTDNPFLPLFYENPERYAFPVELFFMSERHKQLQEHFMQPELFPKRTISDYFFYKTLLFARQNLNEDEYRLFHRLFQTLNSSFPKPDLLIYLHRPVDRLQNNIRNRGRQFETEISDDYLEKIAQAYFDYFRSETTFPILILNAAELDFLQNGDHYALIKELILTPHKPGVNHISIL
jgi:deoxyadenosine/deoxycytidine kinase